MPRNWILIKVLSGCYAQKRGNLVSNKKGSKGDWSLINWVMRDLGTWGTVLWLYRRLPHA